MSNGQQPAFPCGDPETLDYKEGLTKLEYFIAHMIWEPSKADIEFEYTRDRGKNPHNEPHKPPLRGEREIIAYLKIERAKEILKQLEK